MNSPRWFRRMRIDARPYTAIPYDTYWKEESKPKSMIYLIGSMRNPRIPHIANAIRAAGHEVFDDWYSPGDKADEKWQEYERLRGRSYIEALKGAHAKNVFAFDKRHLEESSKIVLALPAGKSAHLELGWVLGQGKPGYILLPPEPVERFDLMYLFATGVFETVEELIHVLNTPDVLMYDLDKVRKET